MPADAAPFDAGPLAWLAEQLSAVIARYGDERAALDAPVARAVEQLIGALAHSSHDGQSLSALEVTRIRLGKFVAANVPAEVFRDPIKLAALRAELHQLARQWLEHSTLAR
jgi:hypothetical protein